MGLSTPLWGALFQLKMKALLQRNSHSIAEQSPFNCRITTIQLQNDYYSIAV